MKKILVAYFSASGVTKTVAEKLSQAIGADLFEIVPRERYTEEDLDWRNKHSRSSVEMRDENCRPAIRSVVDNMAQYNTVFVGFPIWWYREPSIIDTFMEAYDFGGKVLVPFATSGGSGMGESGRNMEALVPGSAVDSGKVFFPGISGKELFDWASQWI